MKSTFFGLFLLLLSVPAAQAQLFSYHPLLYFEFKNGNRVHYQPATGLWRQPSGVQTVRPLQSQKTPVMVFESTSLRLAPGESFETATQGNHDASYFPSKKTAITFFITDQGLYALNQEGMSVQLATLDQIRLDGVVHFNPTPEIQLRDGRQFRGIVLDMIDGYGNRSANLFAVNESLQIVHLDIAGTRGGGSAYQFKVVSSMTGDSKVIQLMLTADGRKVEGHLHVDDWGSRNGFKNYEKRINQAGLGTEVDHFAHYRVLENSVLVPIWRAAVAQARASLLRMHAETKSTGLPAGREVQEQDLPALIEVVQQEKIHGRVGTVLQYHPIDATDNGGNNPAVTNWIEESRKIATLNQTRGFVLIVRSHGKIFAIYHPPGSGSQLQTSLSECNLVYGFKSASKTTSPPDP